MLNFFFFQDVNRYNSKITEYCSLDLKGLIEHLWSNWVVNSNIFSGAFSCLLIRSIYISVYLSINSYDIQFISIYQSIYLSLYLYYLLLMPICLTFFIYLLISIYISLYLSVDIYIILSNNYQLYLYKHIYR